jgi:hypothetical protein
VHSKRAVLGPNNALTDHSVVKEQRGTAAPRECALDGMRRTHALAVPFARDVEDSRERANRARGAAASNASIVNPIDRR